MRQLIGLLVLVVLMGPASGPAAGQKASVKPEATGVYRAPKKTVGKKKPVRIVQVYGPTRTQTGRAEQFRVRVAPDANWPVAYRWSLGDGTMAEGSLIVHRFTAPGRYMVVAEARNRDGVDRDTIYVEAAGERIGAAPRVEAKAAEVEKPEPREAAPVTELRTTTAAAYPLRSGLLGPGAIDFNRKGFTWLVATSLDRDAAVEIMQAFTLAGYRTGLYVDNDGKGSTAYRVGLGQFGTEAEAMAVRAELLRRIRSNAMLVAVRDGRMILNEPVK